MSKGERKAEYFKRLEGLLDEYSKIVVCGCDNVGSKQMQNIRKILRGSCELLMGKNTMIRKCIRGLLEKHPDLEKLLPYVKENVGFVFTNDDLSKVTDAIIATQVGAPARAGAIAPISVEVPAGNTGIEPSQTSFFQALNIATKINRGTIEIINDVLLITEGEKVGSSEAALLKKLNITPFKYGLIAKVVYDGGEVYDAKALEITDEEILEGFQAGVSTLASFCLGANFPSAVSVPHSIINGFKNVLALGLNFEEYSFKQLEKTKEILANPGAFAAAAPAAASGGAAPAAAAKEESEEEEDDDMGFSLFD